MLGQGETAERKTAALQRSGADVVICARFDQRLLPGCALAVGAEADPDDLISLFLAASALGIPVNVVDRPSLCSYITPAIVDRSPLVVAASSGGSAPILARLVREKLEAALPPSYGRLAGIADDYKAAFRKRYPVTVDRRRVLESLLNGPAAELVFAGRDDDARLLFDLALAGRSDFTAPVHLIGAGNGEPDLVTMRAHRLLGEADIVIANDDVPEAIVDLSRRDSRRIRLEPSAVSSPESTQSLAGRIVDCIAGTSRRVVLIVMGNPADRPYAADLGGQLALRELKLEIVPGVPSAY